MKKVYSPQSDPILAHYKHGEITHVLKERYQPVCEKCGATLVERWREANPIIAAIWESKNEG